MNHAVMRLLLMAMLLIMATTSCSDRAVDYYNRGNAENANGDLDGAERDYQRALQLKPDYAEAHCNFGTLLLQMRRVDQAMMEFQKALQLKPDYAEADNHLGLALLQRGKVDEAIACYQKALAINPGYAAARKNLDKALLQKQRAAQAIVH